MPASTLLLIAIGVLSVFALILHVVVHQSAHRNTSRRDNDRSHNETLVADWLEPSGSSKYTSASF